MSPQYSVIDGRPIDKWRVTELREELKRRKLVTRGLKEELVKRLDEAIRMDEEASEEEEAAKGTDSDTESMAKVEEAVAGPKYGSVADDTMQLDENKTSEGDEPKCDVIAEDSLQLDESKSKLDDPTPNDVTGEDGVIKPHDDEIIDHTVHLDQNQTSKTDNSAPICFIGEDLTKTSQVNLGQEKSLDRSDTTGSGTEQVVQVVSVETSITESETVATTISLNGDKINVEIEELTPSQVDAALDVSHSDNQVYEVSPNLGSQIRSESFSTDSVSIFVKNDLQNNFNANNVHLELGVIKHETLQSSSGGLASGSDLPSLDDQMQYDHEGSVDATEDNKCIHVDSSKRDDSAVEVLEKFNQTDDNVKREIMENEQLDSNIKSYEVDVKSNVTEVSGVNNQSLVGAVGLEFSYEKVEIKAENMDTAVASAEEVTLHDDKEPTNMDPSKKSANIEGDCMEKINLDHFPEDDFMEEEVLETKENPSEIEHEIGAKVELIADSKNSVYPSVKKENSSEKKDNNIPPIDKRKFQDGVIDEPPKRQRRWNSESLKIPDSNNFTIKPCSTPKGSYQASVSTIGADAPKERIVPPSPKPPTNSLKIDRFMRPFTLKAVQELLAKTGNVCSFWMDQIKTHCYITYSTIEEATETRNSVYNLQWPPNGGRLLTAEFVNPQEVKTRVESPATPISTTPTTPVAPGQGLMHQNPLPLRAPPPPPKPETEKLEPPIVTLDDLFRKTRATPRIYYLPLAEDQVATKLASRSC